MTDIKVILSGIGGVGRNVTRILNARPGYQVVAAFSRNTALVGQDVGALAGVASLGVKVVAEREAALERPADALVIATTSFLHDVAGDIRAGIEHGINVITTAEEAAFPWLTDEQLANELDRLAKEHQVSVIGMGLNPGFIFDALMLTASGVSWDVQRIRVRRVVDVSRFSTTIQKRIGIGYSRDEFEAGVGSDSIKGHIGFPQSFTLAAKYMGRKLERIDKSFEPLIADRPYTKDNLNVEAGQTAGFIQRTSAIVDGEPWFAAEFIAHIDLPSIDLATEDSISIEGYNPINITVSPGCQPQLGSAAMVANSIPKVVEARPGFLTVADLPPLITPMTHGDLL